MGYATEVPGVPDYHDRYSATNSYKIVAGTGDTFSYEDTAAWGTNIFAKEYAKSYNTLLLRYLADRSH